MPDKQYKMPGKSERRDATPANRNDAVDDTPSGKLLNVQRTWSHEMCESSPDTPGLIQQAQILPTEEPSDATISSPYPLTGCQSVIANTITPGKVQRNPTNKSASIERLIQQNRRGIQFGHLRISPPPPTKDKIPSQCLPNGLEGLRTYHLAALAPREPPTPPILEPIFPHMYDWAERSLPRCD